MLKILATSLMFVVIYLARFGVACFSISEIINISRRIPKGKGADSEGKGPPENNSSPQLKLDFSFPIESRK